ncbi:unnamed protein product [Rotaria sp. Silwood1]|nr:unnamed protein product [Rotaria sp. Silwood1]CAF3754401.1 unnamed protein product [Rotaria sp. Silwood1]CAF3811328.1 unnamed protein product [Rotaria sp. Silwood1]CAF4712382.1 unnamed protein product [Rotaria sp. Silwood1]CAF4761131.1 unnamed protein product [Rotaria sp. Silwood1]
MNIQYIFLGLFFILLLVTSSYEISLEDNNTNLTTPNILTDSVTTLITSTAIPNVTLTTGSITTENVTSNPTTTATPVTTMTATTANITTSSTTLTSTKIISTTIKVPGRKFDMLSFIGGIILTIGLSAIIFLIVSYLRRSNRLPYSNLR